MVYAIGLIGGFVSGFFGAGGGIIILPALIKFVKLDEYTARGTTLATILAAILVSSVIYSSFNYFDFNMSLKIAFGGALGGFLGAKIVPKFSKFWLSVIFDFFLLYVSIKMIFDF